MISTYAVGDSLPPRRWKVPGVIKFLKNKRKRRLSIEISCMNCKNLVIIILAAGQGKRMKSDIPKVLHKVSGRRMLDYVLETAESLSPEAIFLIAGHKFHLVDELYKKRKCKLVYQKEQLGTGHAVEHVLPHLKSPETDVLILSGDMPLIAKDDILSLIQKHKKSQSAAAFLSVEADSKSDFGRVIRDSRNNKVKKIVESKDASKKELSVTEVNTGIYCFKANYLKEALPKLGFKNVQKEKYLPDVIDYLVKKNLKVEAVKSSNKFLTMGINTRIDLAKVSKIINQKKLEDLMLKGVTILDPDSVFIQNQVSVGKDTVIYPFTILEGDTKIGENCILGPFSRITNSNISNSVCIENSVVVDSTIGESSKIGPFAYLRPGSKIGKNVKIGDFVEIKKSDIKDFSKVSHLSYIGDAIIGKNVNIGAGVITCNFDGIKKNITVIGDESFIGANTNLIAPVKVGRGSKTGAGSVVNKDVPPQTLAVGIPARNIKKLKT